MAELTVTPLPTADPVAQTLMLAMFVDIEQRYSTNYVFNPEEAAEFQSIDLNPPGVFLVAWLDGQAVGCGGLRLCPYPPGNDGQTGEIKRMYVVPEMRGRGISRAILTRLEQTAQANGWQRMWLETGTVQPEAVRLYQSAGYRQIANFSEYADDPRSLCYEKWLTE